MPSSAGRKGGTGFRNISKIFPSSVTQNQQCNAHEGHGVCLQQGMQGREVAPKLLILLL